MTVQDASFVPGLVVHGGAGTIPRDAPSDRIEAHRQGLEQALRIGQDALVRGARAAEIVEQVVRVLEDNPCFNAGRGSVYTAQQTHELDAAIMCGEGRRCGAVAGVNRVRHPISLARAVMDNSRHVMMIGTGAERFAQDHGLEIVDPSFFATPARFEAFARARSRVAHNPDSEPADEEKKGTVGAVVLDQAGCLAAGTSTGGLTYKAVGRVGDTPLIGAGTYADQDSCAVSCTGTGEEYIRHGIARDLSARMRYLGESVEDAAEHVIHRVLAPGDGGLIAIDRKGRMAMPFNTLGMYRGCANVRGLFEVKIWGSVAGAKAPPMDH